MRRIGMSLIQDRRALLYSDEKQRGTDALETDGKDLLTVLCESYGRSIPSLQATYTDHGQYVPT